MLSFPMQSTFRGQGNLIELQTWVLIPPLILTGIVLRFSGFSFVSYDMQDFLLGWYDRLATDGFAAFREPFSNYAPLYLYLLCLITKTARFLPRVVAIKLLSIFFDLLNAALVYKILRIKYPQAATAWIGAACFLLLPIVLLNSSYWGQSDAIYACFVLGLAITAMIALTWVTLYARTVKESNPETILLCALVSVVFMPFFLPKMHDRYFYLAEVL